MTDSVLAAEENISITVVQGYTENITSLLLSVLLLVHTISNNANSNKWVIFFSSIDFIIQISLHVQTHTRDLCSTDTNSHKTFAVSTYV